MRALVLATVLTSVLVTSSWAATTVRGSKSNSDNRLRSNLLSASVQLSVPAETKTVYRTPASGDFTLTHVCVSPTAAGGILLSADGLGAIAHPGGSESCASFDPGVLVPPNSNVMCSTSSSAAAGTYFCMISGLQAPPSGPRP